MADDEDGEDDDPIEDNAPVVGPNVRVWNNPDSYVDTMAPTAEEKLRFNIPDVPKVIPMTDDDFPPTAGGKTRVQRDDNVLRALVDKFPDFNPQWGPKIQDKWFASFEILMKAGLR